MKTLIAIVVCSVVAFGGMQLYLWSQKSQKQETPADEPIVTTPWQPEETPPPVVKRPRPSSTRTTPTTKKTTPTTTPTVAKSTTKTSTTSKPKAKQTAQTYFTPQEMNPNGIPSKIVIHNYPSDGKSYVLHLVGVKDLNRGSFRRAIGSGKGGEWEWDVRVDNGVISVSHNGKSIPQR